MDWFALYQLRTNVETKYISFEAPKVTNDFLEFNWDWTYFFNKAVILAKYEIEDLNEYLNLITIEIEQYKSALSYYDSTDKELDQLAEIYYSWGRAIKNLQKNPKVNKSVLLLQEEEKYKMAFSITPNDAYMLYSWAINLRFQIGILILLLLILFRLSSI